MDIIDGEQETSRRTAAIDDPSSSSESDEDEFHSWEKLYNKSWLQVVKKGGQLVNEKDDTGERFNRRYVNDVLPSNRRGAYTKKGLLRYMYLVVDMSNSMIQTDYKQTRLDAVVNELTKYDIKMLGLEMTSFFRSLFIPSFFGLNPLSSMCIIGLQNGVAKVIARMGGQPQEKCFRLREEAMRSIGKTRGSRGSASLVNAIDAICRSAPQSLALSKSVLMDGLETGTREILVLWGSLSSSGDPSPLYPDGVQRLRKCLPNCRVSVVSLAPEVYAVRKLCEYTGGSFVVCRGQADLRIKLSDHLTAGHWPSLVPHLVQMVFPILGKPSTRGARAFWKCACHRRRIAKGWMCCQCRSVVCEIPSVCPCCSLQLVDGDLLARVRRDLFTVTRFQEEESSQRSSEKCSGCGLVVGEGGARCLACSNLFCFDCDMFAHNALRRCPTCMSSSDFQKRARKE